MSDTVIITGMRAPVALDMARSFAAAGWRVVGADSCRWPVGRFSHAVRDFRQLPPPARDHHAFAQALAELAAAEKARLIVPTCEEIFYIARHRSRFPCPVFSPDFDQLVRFHDKGRLPEVASGLGVAVPVTHTCRSLEELHEAYRDLSGACVYKPAFSRFASHVRFPSDADDFSGVPPSPERPWVCQQRVEGREACLYAVARNGELRAISAYYPVWRVGKGAGICFQPFQDAVLEDFCRGIAERHDLTGQVSFDLIRDGAGVWHVIECNPRATSGLHLFRPSAGLAGAVAGDSDAQPPSPDNRPMMVSAALGLFGWADLIRKPQKARHYCSLWRRAGDVVARPGDRLPGWAQIFSIAEVLAKSARCRRPPLVQATYDIEWNGTPLD